MLKLKLHPIGRKNQRKFRIVVSEARSKRDGRYVESIGFYDPTPDPKVLQVDKTRYQEWIRRGARPTRTLRLIIKEE